MPKFKVFAKIILPDDVCTEQGKVLTKEENAQYCPLISKILSPRSGSSENTTLIVDTDAGTVTVR